MNRATSLLALLLWGGVGLALAPTLYAEGTGDPPSLPEQARERLPHIAAEKEQASQSQKTSLQAEVRFGRRLSARILGRFGLRDKEEVTHYLNLVAAALGRYSPRPALTYRVALIDTEEINAYSAPGGYIFITRGALDLMKDESELAGVIAHEIVHITERHILQTVDLPNEDKDQSLDQALGALVAGSRQSIRVGFQEALGQAEKVLFSQGLQDKKAEFTCDRQASLMLATTGYDPLALKRYLQRVADAQQDRLEVIHQTHPPFGERIDKLKTLIHQQGLNRVKLSRAQQRFREHTQGSQSQ